MKPYEDKFVIQTIGKYNDLLKEEENGAYRIVKIKEESLAGYLYEEEKNVNLEIPKLFHGDNVIMELTPKDIQGYFEFIKNARGRVGIVGLGLGYLSQELAKKKEVTEVVVYEISSEVIDIYSKNFKNKKKIKILFQDAYDAKKEKFDFFFVDIYNEELSLKCAEDYKIFNKIHEIAEYSFWGIEHFLLSCSYEEIVWVFIPELWMEMAKDISRILSESGNLKSYKPLNPQLVHGVLASFKEILNEGETV